MKIGYKLSIWAYDTYYRWAFMPPLSLSTKAKPCVNDDAMEIFTNVCLEVSKRTLSFLRFLKKCFEEKRDFLEMTIFCIFAYSRYS